MSKWFIFVFCFSWLSLAQDQSPYPIVVLETSEGNIRIKLFKEDSPKTVAHFMGLVQGTIPFRSSESGKEIKNRPFYQNMIFHKVHPDLGIQTGCPWGNGKGWPGRTIENETDNKLTFNRPYLVGMSNIPSQEKSAGSQFFITTQKSTEMSGKYTVFGEVVSGQEIVTKISQAPTDKTMKPLKPIRLKKIILE